MHRILKFESIRVGILPAGLARNRYFRKHRFSVAFKHVI